MPATPKHLSAEDLLAYWLGETDAATTDAVDEHLMHCDACGEALDQLVALGTGVREAFRAGAVAAFTSGAFVQHVAAQGLRVREYRLPHNGGVNCRIAPDDDLLVSRLQVPLAGVQRLDAVTETSLEPGVRHELHDLPFVPGVDEVTSVVNAAAVKALPEHVLQLTLLAVAPGGERRELGRYTFRHGPWAAP
jgi:hypothetical protein